ncbi:HK97 family phage prohead protease [Sandaracinobacter sp. RS1-74]|uniref:HK97 family phage prohead protease n=1 Tax=Sandaracinobacteroides sayramensis TaxID=2913411 RepID=UPI001EDBEED9|nr:HK97 family phage prohead protease [Sandaracinobacteroides sayramensis]MCG2839767.1 HK97 family phage prohead protease [Sandaracinobacteroides sayramensis]
MGSEVRLTGYVSRFDVPDRQGDVVRRRAFVGAPAAVPLLWQHDPSRPIGRVLGLSEDGHGLKMLAAVSPGCRDGEDALALLRSGAVDGLSFGYRVKSARRRPGGGRELLRLELIECSVVTLPMHEEARVLSVG